MPITFEEVTGEIEPEPAPSVDAQTAATRERPAADMAEQIASTLRLIDERRARLCAD